MIQGPEIQQGAKTAMGCFSETVQGRDRQGGLPDRDPDPPGLRRGQDQEGRQPRPLCQTAP
jgi:hypothetical protein